MTINNLETSGASDVTGIRAQAHLHHAYFLGLQLMIATRKGPQIMGDWMFKLFRRQHEDKFLSSFKKLGLSDLPPAVACAQYHVLSNNIGGVGVEYMPENDRKAWVRFRYPRWMYHGATICGIPIEVSRGFLNGWYAQNGVSLNNPNLGFVCVSEDMSGEYGLCGYFKEYEAPLKDNERLQFAKDEVPPPFDAAEQPSPPVDEWGTLRLEKANRNYALDYIRNGLCTLAEVIEPDEVSKLGGLAARLIGLQYYRETNALVNCVDGNLSDAASYLTIMFEGMGDTVKAYQGQAGSISLEHSGLRIVRGLQTHERDLVLGCWIELWVGALQSMQTRKRLTVKRESEALHWKLE